VVVKRASLTFLFNINKNLMFRQGLKYQGYAFVGAFPTDVLIRG